MRAYAIFVVLLVSGAYGLNDNTNASSSTVTPKGAKAPESVPPVDPKIMTVKPNVNPVALNSTISSTDVSKITTTPTVTTIAPPNTTSPTPAPTPVPNPQIGKWYINGTDAIIVLRMAAQLDIAFNVTSELSIKKEMNVPVDNNVTTVSGKFEKNAESISLSWKASNASGENVVTFDFSKDEKSKKYSLSSVEVSIDASELPGLNSTLKLKHSIKHFNTTIGNSYRCVKLQNFNMTKAENLTQVVGQLKVSDFQFQAFKEDQKSNFGLAEDCAFDTSDVVPIAVGCVLAGLVVIVLVAYLISRRRNQARGYLSM